MKANELYIIEGADYMRHMEEKINLVNMLKHLCSVVLSDTTAERPTVRANMTALVMDCEIDAMIDNWGVLKEHEDGNALDITAMVDNELVLPEDIGYIHESELKDADDDDFCIYCDVCDGSHCYCNNEYGNDETSLLDELDLLYNMVDGLGDRIHTLLLAELQKEN